MTALGSRLAVVAVAAALGAAFVAAGCGGGNNEYTKQVTQAAQQFQTDARGAGTILAAAQSPQQFETAAKKFDAAVKKFTDTLGTLKPPSGAKDEQQKLIADLKHFSGTINEVNDKVQTVNARNVEGLVSLVSQLQVDVANVSKDAQSLEDAVNDS